jgi:hypothetical protein
MARSNTVQYLGLSREVFYLTPKSLWMISKPICFFARLADLLWGRLLTCGRLAIGLSRVMWKRLSERYWGYVQYCSVKRPPMRYIVQYTRFFVAMAEGRLQIGRRLPPAPHRKGSMHRPAIPGSY